MAVGAAGCSFTSGGGDVVGDAHNFVAKELVDPFPLVILDQSPHVPLMIFVGVSIAAEITPEGHCRLLRLKGGWIGLGLVSPS